MVKSALEGKVINNWLVLNKCKTGYTCKCTECFSLRDITTNRLLKGETPRCSHRFRSRDEEIAYYKNKGISPPVEDLFNQKFGTFVVTEYLGNSKWSCKCLVCNCVKEYKSSMLKGGTFPTCNHGVNKQLKDLTNATFGDWKVLRYNPEKRKWLCQCSCNNVRYVTPFALKSGSSTSCGHATTGFKDLSNMTFGDLKVIGRSTLQIAGRPVMWDCQCSCGTVTTVEGYKLLHSLTDNCGCKSNERREETCLDRYNVRFSPQIGTTRTTEQLEMIRSRDGLLKMLDEKFPLPQKPKTRFVAKELGLDRTSTIAFLRKYDLMDRVLVGQQNVSSYEDEINDLFPCSHRSDRQALHGKEIDLYYPEKSFGIEFNGDYWHSEENKPSNHHQLKAKLAVSNGIHLFQIFEYEWKDPILQEKLLKYLRKVIYDDKVVVIQARKCSVSEIPYKAASEFLDQYHFQGVVPATVYIGLTYVGKLLGVMSFGKPRYNGDFEYELIRLAMADGVAITGGVERMFQYFIRQYNPDNILSYCDFSKFTGDTYKRLGFTAYGVSVPNYKWVDLDTNEVIPRYKTTKQSLLDKGYGSLGNTESEIMHALGFTRIYDAGNLKFAWEPKSKSNLESK